ncbi:MAG TPA: energy transducer TonB [Trichormus sp.]
MSEQRVPAKTRLGKTIAGAIALTIAVGCAGANTVLAAGGKKADAQKGPLPFVPRDKWALLVGVGSFSEPGFGTMKNVARNVSSLLGVLSNTDAGRFPANHIVTLVDQNATASAIRAAIFDDGLIKKALPNDLIVLYFFGRVVPSSDHADAVFCTYDTHAQRPSATGVPLKRLLADLYSRTQSKNILCLIDTSPAQLPGLANELQSPDLPRVEHIPDDCHVSVLSANQLFQPSYDNPSTGTTLFCRYLIDGIQTGGGQMSIGDIAAYVKQNVQNDATTLLNKSEQPIFAPIPDNPPLTVTPFGCPSKISSIKQPRVGYPIETLALRRPDLLIPKPYKEDADEQEAAPDGHLDFQPYMSKMKKDIQAKWNPPKGFEDRRVVAVFSILRDGKIANPSIVESSGVESVDKTALDALQAASPLDPLPKGAPKSVQVRYKFDWKVSHQ